MLVLCTCTHVNVHRALIQMQQTGSGGSTQPGSTHQLILTSPQGELSQSNSSESCGSQCGREICVFCVCTAVMSCACFLLMYVQVLCM